MKQIQHILTEHIIQLYKPLHSPAWKMTRINVGTNRRVIATFEPEKRWRLACSEYGRSFCTAPPLFAASGRQRIKEIKS